MFVKILIIITILEKPYAQEYTCEDHNTTYPERFQTIADYKNTKISLHFYNWIEFTDKIFRLESKTFEDPQAGFIRKIGLENNEVGLIESGAFDGLYCVKILLLSCNNIADLSSEKFRGLNNLQALNLSHNELKRIPENSFINLGEILTLDLSYNNLQSLTSNSFAGLKKIWNLNLEHNKILDLPSNIFKPTPNLNTLTLSQNRISVITTPLFEHLNKLVTLDLSNNGISYIYEPIFGRLQKLTSLDLSGNHLRQLSVRLLKTNTPVLSRININENSWACPVLKKVLKELDIYKVAVFSKGRVEQFSDKHVACYDSAATPPTTSDSFPKHVNFFDDSAVISEIENVKTYVIWLLVIVVLLVIVHVLCRVRFVNFRRDRSVLQFRESREDLSLPLLQRSF